MCELLGLNANTRADMRFSFAGLRKRGGDTGNHKDGWGISFYEGRGASSFHDAKASTESELADFIERSPVRSRIIISHIRKANRGKVCMENTHPFKRQLYGCDWVFAHNGQLKGIKKRPLRFYETVGTTDSEHAFCYLMDCIRETFPERPKNPRNLWRLIEYIARKIDDLGVFNFLLSDSKYLYAYCSNHLWWLKRQAPFSEANFIDTENTIDFNQYMHSDDVISIIASAPLTTNENWVKMNAGELLIFKDGQESRLSASLKNDIALELESDKLVING